MAEKQKDSSASAKSAEKQKDSSASAKSAEKTSLSDLDIGKDFLTSWKSMSVTEDDPMDFDFSKFSGGNKNPFKVDNLDMDFNLDNDFGKISSFNVDIPDLDVSSPVKKSAKPNEKSKEVTTDEKTQGKSNRSTFQFDFNEFDDASFGPSLMKKAKQTNANQDAELYLSTSGSLGLKETVGASEGETTSKFDSQLCAEPDSRSKEKLPTPLVGVHIPSKSEISKDQATNVGATTSSQKPISNSTQETFQGNCPKDSSIEPYAKDKCLNSSVQSVSENSSTHQTGNDSQEEFGCLAENERTDSGNKQSLFHDKTDIGIDCGDSQIDKLPVDMAGTNGGKTGNSQFSGDNPVQVDGKYNDESGQGDSQYEQTFTSASNQVLRKTEADGETMDLTSELVRQSNSETTGGDRAMPDPKRLTEVVRSKYFKGSDEAKSQLQQSSLSQTKIANFDSKRIETVQLYCSDKGATMDDKAMEDEESLPNIRSKSFKGLDDTKSYPQQESLSQVKVGSIGSHRITTSQPCTADERTLDGIKVQTGSKFVSLPKPRISETIHPPSKLMLQKDTNSVTNLGQGADLKENTGPRMAHHADTREQAPLSPTLKRKNIEESSANLVMLKPTKRLFLSPGGSRNSRVSSEKLVDKEDLPDDNTKKVLNNSKSSCLQFSQKVDMKEQETPSEMDNDTNVENADACAKELDNLVNMLKKIHEEAKEILVRAVVNNNKLLMLNHPIYEEKFRMIEKFGALWLSK